MRVVEGQVALEPAYNIDVTEPDEKLTIMKPYHVERETAHMLFDIDEDEFYLLQRERSQPDRHLVIQCLPELNASLYNELQALKAQEWGPREFLPWAVVNMIGGVDAVEVTGRPKIMDWKQHQLQNGYMWPDAKVETELAQIVEKMRDQGDMRDKGKETALDDSQPRGTDRDTREAQEQKDLARESTVIFTLSQPRKSTRKKEKIYWDPKIYK